MLRVLVSTLVLFGLILFAAVLALDNSLLIIVGLLVGGGTLFWTL